MIPPALTRSVRNILHCLNMDRTRCRACGTPTAGGSGLCRTCELALAPLESGYCPSCGRRTEKTEANNSEPNSPETKGLETTSPHTLPQLCGDCAACPRPWRHLFFHGRHEGMLRELILAWKFFGRIGLTGLLGDLAAQSVSASPGSYDLVVPVPLHPVRLRQRGFNQSLELARYIARRTGTGLAPRALERTRHTAVQSLMNSVRERRENISGAFRADSAQVRGARIILVDDVLTTGTTLEECVRALKAAGASEADVSVISRAVSH